MPIDKDDTDALRNAVLLLEHPSLAARLTNMVGTPVALMGRALPAGASQAIAAATTKSLEAALKLALLTIQNNHQESSQLLHRALAVASGAAGGAFGILSLPLELPVSTIIILLSILDIARSEGENLTDPESTLSCVEVLGLGGRTDADDAAKSDYFVIRGILAMSVTEAARFIAERGVVEAGTSKMQTAAETMSCCAPFSPPPPSSTSFWSVVPETTRMSSELWRSRQWWGAQWTTTYLR
jgi:hypothetical protein